MKEGYIVWNESNCECEFFGVYKSYKRAERQLRKVVRNRFGSCPRDIDKLVYEPYTGPAGDDSYKITWFGEDNGEGY